MSDYNIAFRYLHKKYFKNSWTEIYGSHINKEPRQVPAIPNRLSLDNSIIPDVDDRALYSLIDHSTYMHGSAKRELSDRLERMSLK